MLRGLTRKSETNTLNLTRLDEESVVNTECNVPASFPYGKLAYFVTSNVHKFLEARRVLAEYGLATAKLSVEAVSG